MLAGILAGLTTCALWGLTFVAPRAIDPFSTFDLTVALWHLWHHVGLADASIPASDRGAWRETGSSAACCSGA